MDVQYYKNLKIIQNNINEMNNKNIKIKNKRKNKKTIDKSHYGDYYGNGLWGDDKQLDPNDELPEDMPFLAKLFIYVFFRKYFCCN